MLQDQHLQIQHASLVSVKQSLWVDAISFTTPTNIVGAGGQGGEREVELTRFQGMLLRPPGLLLGTHLTFWFPLSRKGSVSNAEARSLSST